ncbi:S-methyl-5-thioribose-1-phosphate isomerase [Streptomyces sp. DSM 42041]|uniref:Multifunctional fusion protein n=1 Tax=Streptomyces hazeniae TaxID=3075538 RepID=A0ABU2NYU0_9ACTN|nr:S-methyl-5-thioribose-1-phosphate isomerase [Streptomyces sp. DSM 42041]MDT0382149.1 S-methyl-5-thioribose-1-phosphate isomerase [Streptomyces sp. DSM 42041]
MGAATPRKPGFSLYWEKDAVMAVDQRALPHAFELLRLDSVDTLIAAIQNLAVRGAPAIGLAGAFGVALSARAHHAAGAVDDTAVQADAARLAAARPTAVNLAWGVRRALGRLPGGPQAVLDEAMQMVAEDAAVNAAAARRAAELVGSLLPDRPLRLLTHCNTGRLATAAGGTALGAILKLAHHSRVAQVMVDETRPLLQGARLTAWELGEAGVPYRICVDSAAAAAMSQGLVDCVLVGADRIAANGDTANKIGTYGLALAAARHGIPFIVVAPESTWDHDLPDGSGVAIEERDPAEVTTYAGTAVAPAEASVFNPAFDVTPAELITAVVTEDRVVRPRPGHHEKPLRHRIAELVKEFPDYPKASIRYQDLSPLYADPGLLADASEHACNHFSGRFDRVVAVEARGFALGAVMAARAGVPLTLVRKPGKLPGEVQSVSYALEYGEDRLEVQQGAIAPGERVVCVDDVLATGGTLRATAELVEASQAKVAGAVVLVTLSGLLGAAQLQRYDLLSLCEVAA